jgi:hypothetical protein
MRSVVAAFAIAAVTMTVAFVHPAAKSEVLKNSEIAAGRPISDVSRTRTRGCPTIKIWMQSGLTLRTLSCEMARVRY